MPGSSPTVRTIAASRSRSPQITAVQSSGLAAVAASGSSGPSRSTVAASSAGDRQAAPARLVRGQPGVPARAGEDPEPAAPGPRAPRDGEHLGQLEQVVHVLRPRGARLLDQRPEHALVAGQRARVRGRRRRTRRRRADLQHRHADVPLGRPRQRGGQPLAVAVGLEEQRHGAHVLLLDQRLEQRGRVEHGLVADRGDGVEPQAAAQRERVDRHVPGLRDERDPPRLARHERVAPQRRARVEGDEPVAVRPDHGHPGLGRRRGQRRLQRRRRRPRRTRPRRRRRSRSRAAPPRGRRPGRRPPGSPRRRRRRARAGRRPSARTRARGPTCAWGGRPRPARRSPARRG